MSNDNNVMLIKQKNYCISFKRLSRLTGVPIKRSRLYIIIQVIIMIMNLINDRIICPGLDTPLTDLSSGRQAGKYDQS